MLRLLTRFFNSFAYSRANTAPDVDSESDSDTDIDSDMQPLRTRHVGGLSSNPLYGIQTRDPFTTLTTPTEFASYNLTNCELFEEREEDA